MTDSERKQKTGRALIGYAVGGFLACLFGSVYTYFGFGVTSAHMTFAFAPLAAGFAVYLLLRYTRLPYPGCWAARLFAFSLTAFTMHHLIEGVFDIAGAFSEWAFLMPVFAALLLALALFFYFFDIYRDFLSKTTR